MASRTFMVVMARVSSRTKIACLASRGRAWLLAINEGMPATYNDIDESYGGAWLGLAVYLKDAWKVEWKRGIVSCR